MVKCPKCQKEIKNVIVEEFDEGYGNTEAYFYCPVCDGIISDEYRRENDIPVSSYDD